ncbi:hypothetical protein AB4Y45_32575 [Paraburkholderia sp. EG287A]|uniref:hypothetical protein n=1 Tax=Paraburkholderia sp. EG287A TaxID=3237012 RepID=UPI0034D27E22
MQMQTTPAPKPYMPDSARAAMPNSPLQPLPPYLREDFAQSFDHSRPHELIVPVRKGKPADPTRMSCLQYRYLDTQETVTVPNIWYNQTRAMRVAYWRWQAAYLADHVRTAKERLKHVEQHTGETYMGRKTSHALHYARVDVEQRTERHEQMLQLLADVESGQRFV